MKPHTILSSASSNASDTDALIDWLSGAAQQVIGTGRQGLTFAVIGAVIGAAVAFALPPQFTSTATFIAQGASTPLVPSALRGLVTSMGLSAGRDFSPQFYVDLLTSDPVLTAALDRSYPDSRSGARVERTYYDIEGFTGHDHALETDKALKQLRKRVIARADARTNIVSVSVDARSPELSRDIATTLLQALDSLNIRFRQEQSRDLREFFEARVRQAQLELDSAETVLRQFLERNRQMQNSPLLQFEQMRLTRAADLKRTVYMTVVEQFEEAKLQESRNVPVLTVLTGPSLPVKKSGPPRRFIIVTFAILTFGLIFVLRGMKLFVQRFRSARADPIR
jgi:uncharacterized protein involved in exopolysaccharide biosynthesis